MPKRVSKRTSYGKRRKSRYGKRISGLPYSGSNRVRGGSYTQSTRGVSRAMSLFSSWAPVAPGISGKMLYVEQINLISGAAGLTGLEQVYRLNSLFDPNFTGAGHQPYGMDQIQALYGSYRVTACDVELEFFNCSETGAFVLWTVSGPLDPLSTQSILPDKIMERNNAGYAIINQSGSNQIQRVKFRVYIADVVGVPRTAIANDLYDWASSMTNNPTNPVYLRFNLASSQQSTSITCTCTCKLTYHYQAWDRKSQAQS